MYFRVTLEMPREADYYAYIVAFARCAANAGGLHPRKLQQMLESVKVENYSHLVWLIHKTEPKLRPGILETDRKHSGYRYNLIQVMAAEEMVCWSCMDRQSSETGRENTFISLRLGQLPAVVIAGNDAISIARRLKCALGANTPPAYLDR